MSDINIQNQYFNVLDNLLQDHGEEISTSRLCTLFHINLVQSKIILQSYIRSSKPNLLINLLISGTLLDSTKSFIVANQFSLDNIKKKFQLIESIQIYSLTLLQNNSFSSLSWQKEIRELSQAITNDQNTSIWVPNFTFFQPVNSDTKRSFLFENNNNQLSSTLISNNSKSNIKSKNISPSSLKIENNPQSFSPSTYKVQQENDILVQPKNGDSDAGKMKSENSIKIRDNSISPPNKKPRIKSNDNDEDECNNSNFNTNSKSLFESDDDLESNNLNSDNFKEDPENNLHYSEINNCVESDILINKPLSTIKQKIVKDVTFQKDGYLVIEKTSVLETKQVQKDSPKKLILNLKDNLPQKPKLQQGIMSYFKKKLK